MSVFNALTDFAGKLLDRVMPDRAKQAEAQSRVNEAEVAGAPASKLRLWRSFLGWVLALVFAWEVAGRTIVLTYWPGASVPPSMLREVSALLLAMLGVL